MNSSHYNIYTFWLGNKKRKKELENKIIAINEKIWPYKIILGPYEKDHQYLMKYYKYYKNSFERKIYAFCSDVWRLWILNNNRNNFYIDAGCLINVDKFKEYLNSIDKNKDLYFVESKTRIWFGFIYISENSPYIEYLDYVYRQRNLLKNPHCYPITDQLFMKILVHKFHCKFGYENIKKNPAAVFGSCKFFDTRQVDWIIKNGSTNSWVKNKKGNNKKHVQDFWIHSWDNFDNSKCRFYDWFTWIYYRITPLVFIKRKYKNDTSNSVIDIDEK